MTNFINHLVNYSFDIFLKVLQKDENEGFIISPVAMSQCIGSLLSGLEHSQKEEIEEGLGLPICDNEESAEFISKLAASCKNDYSSTVNQNYLLHQTDRILLDRFRDTVKKNFKTEVIMIDKHVSLETIKKMNQKLAAKEEDASGSSSEDIQHSDTLGITLLNIFTSYTQWRIPFEPSNETYFYSEFTDDEGHTVIDDTCIDMMQQQSNCNYYKNETFSAVEFEYVLKNFSFVVFLPNKDKSLCDLKNYEFRNGKFNKIIKSMEPKKLNILLPKWSESSQFTKEFFFMSDKIKDSTSRYNLCNMFKDNDSSSESVEMHQQINFSIFNAYSLLPNIDLEPENAEDEEKITSFKCNRPFLYFLTYKYKNEYIPFLMGFFNGSDN